MLTHQKSNPSVENLVSAVDVLSVNIRWKNETRWKQSHYLNKSNRVLT